MKQIDALHCQACGSTAAEDVGYEARRRNDGYTACCNERAVGPGCDPRDCYHDLAERKGALAP
jgi:hypothetical protein